MSARVIVEVTVQESTDPIPASLRTYAEQVRATDPRPSHPELPGIVTLVLPDDIDPQSALEVIRALPGVRRAEMDAFSTTL
ncbi:MAG: hypothetical protein ACXWXV_07475 [Aeromicrobium sp.]